MTTTARGGNPGGGDRHRGEDSQNGLRDREANHNHKPNNHLVERRGGRDKGETRDMASRRLNSTGPVRAKPTSRGGGGPVALTSSLHRDYYTAEIVFEVTC
jgi:hypothetical protein